MVLHITAIDVVVIIFFFILFYIFSEKKTKYTNQRSNIGGKVYIILLYLKIFSHNARFMKPNT